MKNYTLTVGEEKFIPIFYNGMSDRVVRLVRPSQLKLRIKKLYDNGELFQLFLMPDRLTVCAQTSKGSCIKSAITN